MFLLTLEKDITQLRLHLHFRHKWPLYRGLCHRFYKHGQLKVSCSKPLICIKVLILNCCLLYYLCLLSALFHITLRSVVVFVSTLQVPFVFVSSVCCLLLHLTLGGRCTGEDLADHASFVIPIRTFI